MEAVPKSLVRLNFLLLVVQDPKPATQAASKKKKKSRQVKATGEILEGFVDWTNLVVSQLAEEREVKLSGLVAGFAICSPKPL